MEEHQEHFIFNRLKDVSGYYAPRPSATQIGVFQATYKYFWGLTFVDGPSIELRIGYQSLDIPFPSHRVAYEVDHDDFHDPDKDKDRDLRMLYQKGWKVYRVNCKEIDYLGYDEIGRQIYLHFMYTNGFVKEKRFDEDLFTNLTFH